MLLASLLSGCGASSTTSTVGTTTAAKKPRLPSNVVRIHWRKESLKPATRPGHVCITTLRLGHFCAAYKAGEIPANALSRKLAARGLVVLPT